MKKKAKKLLERCVVFVLAVVLTITTFGGYYEVHAEAVHNGHAEWTDLSSVSGTYSYEHEITASGNYYLSDNVTSSEKSQFLHVTGDIDVTICLNGHSIGVNKSNIFIIDGGARVTITNCSEEESKIDAGTAIGRLIYQTGGTLKLENVTLVEKQGDYYDEPLVHVGGGISLSLDKVKFDSQGFCLRLDETGDINIDNSTFTVSNDRLDGGGKIIYTDMDKTIGNITVTDSIFNWDKNIGVSITTPNHGSVNISGSTFNCSGGISVKGGEVNVSDCRFEGTDEYSLGSAIYMTSVADKDNKLTVSGGKYNTRYSGINVDSRNAEVDVTLKGNIEFNHTSESGDLTFYYWNEPYTAHVNLHMDELTTQNLTMYVPSTEYEGAITCDADYSEKLKARDVKYAVHCEEANGKYVVKFNERKITTQPTVDSTKVEVSDNTGVSFQWYKAGEKAYELNAAGIEGVLVPDENYHCYVGSYENGVWKPENMPMGDDMYGVMFEIEDFKENCTVVIENTKGSLEEYKDCFMVQDLENCDRFESEVKDGKLYFGGKADGLSIGGAGVPQDAELIVKLIVPNDTEALQGQNTNTLTAAQPGDYRCHAIWDAGTDYSYEILSDTLTINQAIAPDELEDVTITNIEIPTGLSMDESLGAMTPIENGYSLNSNLGADYCEMRKGWAYKCEADSVNAFQVNGEYYSTYHESAQPQADRDYYYFIGIALAFKTDTYTTGSTIDVKIGEETYTAYCYDARVLGNGDYVYNFAVLVKHIGKPGTVAPTPAKDIKLNKASATLSVGEELTLKVTAVDGTAVSGAVWSSSNEKVATVENGIVKAVAVGTAAITVTVDGKTATCTVTVKKDEGDTTDKGDTTVPDDDSTTDKGDTNKEYIVNDTRPTENAFSTNLSETPSELKSKVLTAEEKERVAKGEFASIYLQVVDISEKVSDTDKVLVENAKGESTIGMYIDITMYAKVGASEPRKVTNTNGTVTITVQVPETLINTDSKVSRTYQIIRVHDGIPSVITCTYDEATKTISFETDAFSTYALAYSDTVKKVENTGTSSTTANATPTSTENKGTSPKTGDNTPIGWLFALVLVSASGMIVVVKKRKLND